MPYVKELEWRPLSRAREAAGKHRLLICQVCGLECAVERNISYERSSLYAPPNPYDDFKCLNWREKWHFKAENLIREYGSIKSPSLRRLILNDVLDILKKNEVSRKRRQEVSSYVMEYYE